MTMYNLLPFVGGWSLQRIPMGEGTPQTYPQGFAVMVPDQELMVFNTKYEIGWFLSLGFASNDCYMALRIQTNGYDSGWGSPNAAITDPYLAKSDAVPWGPKPVTYCRTNQNSSVGVFELTYASFYYPVPYHGYLRIWLKLLPQTTQPFAVAVIGGHRVVVTDPNRFLKDYRKIQYGRWAPIFDMISSTPILRSLTHRLDLEKIHFEEKEEVEPKVLTR